MEVYVPRGNFGFEPDRGRAARLDASMRDRLAESLLVIAAELDGDQADLSADLTGAAHTIRSRSVSPAVFAHYFGLVGAIAAGQDTGVATAVQALGAQIAQRTPRSRVLDLDDTDLGPGGAEAVTRVIDDDDGGLAPGPVGAETVKAFNAQLDDALDLIERTDPAMAGELDVLARTIILARSTRPDGSFGGATSPFLWGAVVINPERQGDRIALAETLIHESAHALLFGLAGGEPLSSNDRAERYCSPLRSDLRPMEGIIHATYVLARMICGLQKVLRSRALSEVERDRTVAAVHRHRLRFIDGLKVIDAQANLTREGRAIFEPCRAAVYETDAAGSAPA